MSLGNILPMMGDNDKTTTLSSVGRKTRADETIKEVMHRWGQGTLHAGPGGKNLAESQEQALAIAYNIAEDAPHDDGGSGSGNFGHAGRAGMVGGSSGEGGAARAKGKETMTKGQQKKTVAALVKKHGYGEKALKAFEKKYTSEHGMPLRRV